MKAANIAILVASLTAVSMLEGCLGFHHGRRHRLSEVDVPTIKVQYATQKGHSNNIAKAEEIETPIYLNTNYNV